MNLFFDTNVVVGYSIEYDPWHYYAKRLFDKFNSFYWSNTVEEETNDKINKLLDFYATFFNIVKDNLDKYYFTKNEFFNIFNNVTHIDGEKVPFEQKYLSNLIWEDGGWYEEVSLDDIYNILDNILDNLNSTVLNNLADCSSKLKLHKRVNNYSKLLNVLKNIKDKKNKLHNPDNYIILDCHDLSICKNIDLIFVSSDKKLLSFSKDIIELTNIDKMVFIEDAYYLC